MIKFTRIVDYKTMAKETVIVGVGTTPFTQSKCEQIMSDVWEYITRAHYWDSETRRLESVCLNENTEFVIDGNFDAIKEDFLAATYERSLPYHLAKAKNEALNPAVKGLTVKVTRGKTSKGVQGKVVVVIERPYSMGWKTSLENKLGIALDDEMTTYTAKNGKQYPTHKNIVWVWARNCEVVNPEIDTERAKSLAMGDAERAVASMKLNIAQSDHKPVSMAA